MRLVFMGTPDFAVPVLEQLLADGHEIGLVITQPDRSVGRGRRLSSPPVKAVAQKHGLAVLQPGKLREPDVLEALRSVRPEVIVVAAFGQLLPTAVLDLPPLGCLNVHASLLPRWRGAAPIPAAILAGDDISGVTIMLMERGLDTGPVLTQARESIEPRDTAAMLGGRLAQLGARLLAETLPRWAEQQIAPRPQAEAAATYAPRLRKDDGLVDWNLASVDIWRRCRAFNPWPVAFTRWQGKSLRILAAAPLLASNPDRLPGTVGVMAATDARGATRYPELLPTAGHLLAVTAADGSLALLAVQPEGGRVQTGEEYARGHGPIIGDRLGG
ncbi:MAG: methionyl-tRNA formyltransferase [Chloroflexi bacterium]|nr:methionyl-tRNA formyltransferase [Chloroflexota bacterium]MCL5108498.1 methionyl-tRNA formyltransferase [Chloroflexota bacterium]